MVCKDVADIPVVSTHEIASRLIRQINQLERRQDRRISPETVQALVSTLNSTKYTHNAIESKRVDTM